VRRVEELIGAVAAAGTKILMTTHDIAQAKRLAADVLFLNEGRLLEHAPAAEFFASPKDPAAARFLDGELLG
jgi:tungstate transport system ATP-binding protein